MPEYILGVSYGHHESSCCLFSSDGSVEYIREEWVSRVKNDFRFPIFSLSYLKNKNPDLEKNLIAVSLFEKPLKNWLGTGTKKNLSVENYLNKLKQFKNSDIYFEKHLKKIFRKVPEVLYCPHHLSHLFTSEFLLNNNNLNTLNIILDAYGEGLSGAIYIGQGKKIKLLKEFDTSSSLGLLYSGVTEWSGFKPNEDEYKVMALSGFGEPKFVDFIEKNIIQFNENTLDISINSNYFNFEDSGKGTITDTFIKQFGNLQNNKSILGQQQVLDCICSFQLVIEKIIVSLLSSLLIIHPQITQVFLSGGLFHNSKLVGEITRKINIRILVSPSPGDAGSSIGAAYFAMLCLGKKYVNKNESPFLGPKVPSLKQYSHLFSKLKLEDVYLKILDILSKDEIFAVFSGYSEIGPRALLSRSLCCNAKSAVALEYLNTKIKKREVFRPIAPVMHKKYALDLFEMNDQTIQNSFWMGQLLWPKKNDSKLNAYPFYHIDGSVRVQIFDDDSELLKKFIPKLIQRLLNEGHIIANTSLNISGDPMVFLPEDLYINCKRLDVKYVLQDKILYKVS